MPVSRENCVLLTNLQFSTQLTKPTWPNVLQSVAIDWFCSVLYCTYVHTYVCAYQDQFSNYHSIAVSLYSITDWVYSWSLRILVISSHSSCSALKYHLLSSVGSSWPNTFMTITTMVFGVPSPSAPPSIWLPATMLSKDFQATSCTTNTLAASWSSLH